MSFLLIMRPDQSNRPERYFPYYSTGPKVRGDSPSRQFFRIAGADSSIDSSLDIVDDTDALFGKKYDFARYISAVGDTYISKTFFIPALCLGQINGWDDQFTIMTKLHLTVWPVNNIVSLFSFTGNGFRGGQYQFDIGLMPTGTVRVFGNNSIGSRWMNQLQTPASSFTAGQRVTFCLVCDLKQELGKRASITAYIDGALLGSVEGDFQEGWRMNEMDRQPWEALHIGLGGGNLYPNSQHYIEYMAMWQGLYPSPETVVAGGAFETILQNQSPSVGDSWPPVGKVQSGVQWIEEGVQQTGNRVDAPIGKVQASEQYGENGTEFTGTRVDASENKVLTGESYGEDGTEFSGNVDLPLETQVEFGVQFGSNGELSGTFTGTQAALQAAGFTTLPRLEGALANWQQDMVFTTVTKEVVNFEEVETRVDLNFKGVWQPFTSERLLLKPEGQRSWRWFTCHATINIQLNTDDIIEFQETKYRVMERSDWKEYGFIEYHLVEDFTEVS